MRKIASTLATLALLCSAFAFAAPSVSAFPSTFCIEVWEDEWYGKDHWEECGDYVGDADLRNNSRGLGVNGAGCNRNALVPSSSWNDCISSVRVGGISPNYKVLFKHDINYGGGTIWCYDGDGGNQVPSFQFGANDAISSIRVMVGDC